MRRGEIWWVDQNPVLPNDQHLPRPVVIVSPNSRNKHWTSVIVVPCSTSILNPNERFHVPLKKGEGGIPDNCHVRCDLVSNIDKNCLNTEYGALGELSTVRMWEIVRGIRWSIGDNVFD